MKIAYIALGVLLGCSTIALGDSSTPTVNISSITLGPGVSKFAYKAHYTGVCTSAGCPTHVEMNTQLTQADIPNLLSTLKNLQAQTASPGALTPPTIWFGFSLPGGKAIFPYNSCQIDMTLPGVHSYAVEIDRLKCTAIPA